MTKTEMFAAIRANLVDAEQIAFIDHEIEMIAKRNANRSSKPSKAQLEKDALRAQIRHSSKRMLCARRLLTFSVRMSVRLVRRLPKLWV